MIYLKLMKKKLLEQDKKLLKFVKMGGRERGDSRKIKDERN